MRKIISAVAVAALLLSTTAFSAEDRPDFVTTPKGMIIEYYGENDVYIPSAINGRTIYDIDSRVFFDLNISSVYIEEGLLTIGNSAFEGSNITSVTLPSSILEIGERAFANCAELEDIYCYHRMPLFGVDDFIGTGNITFHIACSTNENAWKRAIESAKGDSNYTIEYNHNLNIKFGGNTAVCADCGVEIPIEVEYVIPFNDVSNDAWYYEYVSEAHQSGIINGKSIDKFDPDAGMTVAEAVKIAASIYAREHGEKIKEATSNEAWYQPCIDYCYDKGIIAGDIIFEWDKEVTRSEMAYLFARCSSAAEIINPDVPLSDIPDVYETTPYNEEILKLYRTGIAAGSDANYTFHPDSGVKRSEAAAFVARILSSEYRIELPKG